LTFGDQSLVEPDADRTGKLLASRIRGPSDIWKFPVSGSRGENTRDAIRVTRQTGEVRSGQSGLSVIHSDGSGVRQVIAMGRAPCWSGDGRWLYYESLADGALRIEKVLLDGSQPVVVRDEVAATLPAISADGSTLYYEVILRSNLFGSVRAGTEIRCARPEDGEPETLARIPGERIPGLPPVLGAALSPDGQWLAMPLVEGATTNLWVLQTAGGALKPLTDFGDRSIVIARSVSWSADSQYLYAAVAETETDVVLFDGLIS
jgi:hypothetical protein